MRILVEEDQRVLLDGVLAAFGTEPVAVLDPGWPETLRLEAVERIRRAADVGTLRDDSLVFFTSGSTGRPRAVHRSAASWAVSADVFTGLVGAGPCAPVLAPGPLHSTLFLFAAWHASVTGAPVILAGEDDRCSAVVHGVPAAVPALLERHARGDLPALTTLVVAGDRMPAALARSVRERGLLLVEYYGSAELSLVAARTTAGPLRPVSGVEARIDSGALWSRSAYQAHGYLDGGGPFRRDADGWATVGDLARPDGDGFVVLGRGDAAVTTGGHTVVVEDVEQFLRERTGVEDVAVVGVPHPRLGQSVVAVVVGDVTDAELRDAVRVLPRAARPRRFVHRTSLPRTGAGKLLRGLLACETADDGALAVASGGPPDAAQHAPGPVTCGRGGRP